MRRQLGGKENLPFKIVPLNTGNTVSNETITLTGTASYRVFAVELEQAAKVTSRMAHDFGNLLTGVLGFAELTLPLLPPNTPQHNYMSELLRVVQQGMTFTQQMHQFSRSGQKHPRPLAVGGLPGVEPAG